MLLPIHGQHDSTYTEQGEHSEEENPIGQLGVNGEEPSSEEEEKRTEHRRRDVDRYGMQLRKLDQNQLDITDRMNSTYSGITGDFSKIGHCEEEHEAVEKRRQAPSNNPQNDNHTHPYEKVRAQPRYEDLYFVAGG